MSESSRPPKIKTIISPSNDVYAVFLPLKGEEPIIERVVCWSLIDFRNHEDPDEIVGSIIDGASINEVTNLDEEDGFGDFLGYFHDASAGRESALFAMKYLIEEKEGPVEETDEEDDDDGEDEYEDEGDEDDDEDDDDEDEDEGDDDDDDEEEDEEE